MCQVNESPASNAQTPEPLRQAWKDAPMKWYAQLVGYCYPVLLGVLLVKNLVERMWDCVLPDGSKNPALRPDAWQARALSYIEAVLYVAFFQLGHPWFPVAWLALKIAGNWQRWSQTGNVNNGIPAGTAIFNVFMIGNAILILHSFVGYKIIVWMGTGRWLRAFWAPLLIVAFSILLYHWLARFRKTAP
jgi:hypothetical protein